MNQTTITIDNVRFSFLSVLKPREPFNGQGDPKYSATILVPKSDVAAKHRIDAAIASAIEEGVNKKWNGVRPPAPPIPVYDGDGVRPSDGAAFGPECKGHWVFTASANVDYPPAVVGADRQAIMNAAEVYSGMYGSVNVRFYAYAAAGKRGIGCGLNGIMKTRDGEPLGSVRQTPAEMFGAAPAAPVQPQYAPQPQGAYQQPYAAPAQPQYGQQPQQTPDINPFTGLPSNGGVMGL